MDLTAMLLRSEKALTEEGGDAYRRVLTDDALVIVPGQVLNKTETIAAIDASPRWDRADFHDPQLRHLGEDAAAITYRFEGRRGDADPYRAVLTSVYVERNGDWLLSLHQQTPQ